MDDELTTIKRILDQNRVALMNKSNVVASGIGFKTTAGRKTNQLAIICSVEIKKGKELLRAEDLIPAAVQNIPTDVNPIGSLRAFQKPTDRFRPALGGVSIGHYQITAGTLGCIVQRNKELFILSNNHVLANSNESKIGDSIIQPGSFDGGINPKDRIAVLIDFVPIQFQDDKKSFNLARAIATLFDKLASALGSHSRLKSEHIQHKENKVDCAIAQPVHLVDIKNDILHLGPAQGIMEGKLGMAIKKSGRTTGLTHGFIEQISVTAKVNYGTGKNALFVDQYMAGAMSQGGDSGSAVLNEEGKLVGLLFAGSDTSTIINKIEHVFNALDITLPLIAAT